MDLLRLQLPGWLDLCLPARMPVMLEVYWRRPHQKLLLHQVHHFHHYRQLKLQSLCSSTRYQNQVRIHPDAHLQILEPQLECYPQARHLYIHCMNLHLDCNPTARTLHLDHQRQLSQSCLNNQNH